MFYLVYCLWGIFGQPIVVDGGLPLFAGQQMLTRFHATPAARRMLRPIFIRPKNDVKAMVGKKNADRRSS
jgi:hypothetical protein